MSLLITCPLPTAIGAISEADFCPVDFRQIQRIAFQRKQATAPFEATGEAVSPIDLQTSWDTYIAAADSTKIQISPYITEFVITGSEAITEGGDDNTTIDGVPVYNGEGIVNVAGVFRSLPPSIADELRTLSGESVATSGAAKLTAFFFNEGGSHVVAKKSGADYEGVEIYNFRISTVASEGLNAPNKYAVTFTMKGNWDTGLAYLSTAFNTLALTNA
jgi:hypothetical protein